MEGKSLAEKLENAQKLAASREQRSDPMRGNAPEGMPIRTPHDVRSALTAGAAATQGSTHDASPDVPQDVDAIVRAAKAMRDGICPDVVQQASANICLIVDDSRVIRKVSSKIARSLGYVPLEAQDGIEALARCKRAMPKLILTDWNMPEMDGLEFVRQLRAIPTPKPPTVVFCTSKGGAEDIHQGIEAGADDYIVKPFDEAGLRAKLERLAQD